MSFAAPTCQVHLLGRSGLMSGRSPGPGDVILVDFFLVAGMGATGGYVEGSSTFNAGQHSVAMVADVVGTRSLVATMKNSWFTCERKATKKL